MAYFNIFGQINMYYVLMILVDLFIYIILTIRVLLLISRYCYSTSFIRPIHFILYFYVIKLEDKSDKGILAKENAS